ncbi:Hypothetical protein I5071_61100 [Sandaracinus amylolyticus]|nr:Hypothetical protein I5071_61100 [Sandaracinus amylolyticus]
MGEVWAGAHVAQGVPIAMKMLRGERALARPYVWAFRREAERLAALDHPAIVTIFDYGTLPDEVAAASRGALVPGSPYLAMELCDGGALATRGRLAWSEVAWVLRVLLDALAHAHARGVLHRDIKPANVLVSSSVDPSRPGIVLSDFGIACALDADDEPVRFDFAGTHGYMAPEQVRGDVREFGPWTDLFALGCSAWALLAGHAPFRAAPAGEARRPAIERDLPSLPDDVSVPHEARAFLEQLTRRDPRERFQRAADAASALESIASTTPAALPRRFLDPQTAPTLDSLRTRVASTSSLPTLEITSVRDAAPARVAAAAPALATTPTSWRTARTPPARMQLLGAGLSLYGAREVPLADRDEERDRLWRALVDVQTQRHARVVVLRGPSGVGKTRLLRWVLHRAHELGAGTTLLATHAPERSVRDGFAPALARHLRCVGLPADALRARIARLLDTSPDPMEIDALFALLAPFACPEGAPQGTSRDTTLHALRRAIAREASARALVIGLDDLQWGDDTVRILRALREGDSLPMLVVATVQDEAPLVAPDTRAALEALERDAISIALGPLGAEDHLRLIEQLLRLEPALARELARRTAGNPLFAEQLVGDWVRRGVLEVRPAGLTLREGVAIELPDDLHAVWIARVERLLHDRSDHDREALELAALLGHRVDEDEWARACAFAGLGSPRELGAALTRARLLERDHEGGLSFVHGMLRESVLRASRDAGRRDRQARTIEVLLRGRIALGTRDAGERLGRLLAEHGRGLEAAPLLVSSADARREACEHGTALALLDEAEMALDAAGVGPEDVARAAAWVGRASALRMLGDYPAAIAAAERVLAHQRDPAWTEHVPWARLRRAEVVARQGRMHVADPDLAAAEAELARRGELGGVAQIASLRAWAGLFAGDLDGSLAVFARLRALLSGPEAPPPGPLHVDWSIGFAHVAREEPELAEAAFARADEGARRLRNRLGLAHACCGRASIALMRDDPTKAVELAREALALYPESFGAQESHFALFNLGVAWRRLGRLDDARAVLVDGISSLVRGHRPGFASRLQIALAVVEAQRGSWDDARTQLDAASAFAREYGVRETVLARELEHLVPVATSASRDDLARDARDLARRLRAR